ncbi:NTE family protein RssA [compost metagenome]
MILTVASASLLITEPALAKRPRVGLILGGGGARGFAHVGILKVLEENHIPIDCIVGTSIGALVGAGYAAGRSPAEMQERITQVDWDRILYSQVPRQALPFRTKQDGSLSLLNIEIGLSDKFEFKLPHAAISTQHVELFLRSLTYGGTVSNFDKLSIPYRAIATDLVTGEMVVLKDGDLVTAMRASMAVPGIFPSVPTGGRSLVDGGLVRNLPVDVARQTCADVVIAVDVGATPMTEDQITSIFSVADQYTRIMMIQNVQPQVKGLSPQDTLIIPTFGDLGSTDFKMSKNLFAVGESAARAALPQLKKYSVSPAQYAEWSKERETRRLAPKPIKKVEVGSSGWVNPEVLKSILDVKPGELLPQDNFASRLTTLYARGDFSQLDYELIDNVDGQNLIVLPVKKSWGPNYLNFGLSLGTDFVTSYPWSLTAMYRRTWMNSLGAEWKSIAQVGSSTLFKTEFYQPLQLSGYSFISPYFRFNRQPVAFWQDGDHVGEYEYTKSSVGFDLGSGWTKYGELRLGPVYNNYQANRQIGPSILPNSKSYDYGLRLNLYYDQLDSYFFPRQGQYLDLYAYYSMGGSDDLSNYGLYGFLFRNGMKVGPGAVQLTLKAQYSQGDNDTLADVSWLGGFLNLSSYRYQEMIGDEFAYGSAQYYQSMKFLSGTYWGMALESGRVFDHFEKSLADSWHYSGTAYLAYDSILGPMYLAGAYGDNDNLSFYFMLGKQF